jgi:hypothetical protein
VLSRGRVTGVTRDRCIGWFRITAYSAALSALAELLRVTLKKLELVTSPAELRLRC